MDYPKSVAGVGLVNGKFIDENEQTGQQGSLIPALWGNDVTDEILAVQAAGGQVPDETKTNQLLLAIQKLIQQGAGVLAFSLTDLPKANIGPIIVKEVMEVWGWSSSAYFTGYRSPLCGRPLDGHTASPLPSEIDATGGVLSKTAYAGLWGYALENNLAVLQANWTANIGAHYFVDVDANTFRVPDLRGMFRRYTGTDADTGSARARGSRQLDALQNITGGFGSQLNVQTSANGAFALAASGTGAYATGNSGDFNQFTFNASRVARTSTETRGANTAYSPRLHI